jgi:hypothetical protein
MDLTLFGTGVDTSNRLMGICFTDQNRLPSGLHIPQVVGHPLEQRNIWQLYPQILQWAASGGVVNPGWYLSPVNGNQYPAQLTPTLPNGEADMKPNLACLPPAPLGTGFPSVAHRASSPSFKVQGTLGDFSASPGAMSSPSYTVRGGIAGANGQ